MNWLQRLLQAPQNMLQQPQAQAAIPMMDNASMRVAQAAGTPNPNMQPMPGSMAAPAEEPSFLDRFRTFRDGDGGKHLGDIFAGWAMGRTPSESLGLGAAFAREGSYMREGKAKEKEQINKTVEYLKARGIDPDSAALMASSPQTLQEFLKKTLVPGQDKATEYGLNPIYATDPATGETVLGTLGKDGSFKRIDTGGVQISTGVDKVDLGTHWGLLDKRSGQMVGSMPKENYQESYDRGAGAAQGKADVEAAVSAPQDLQTAMDTVRLVDELMANRGLKEIVGPLDQYRPKWTMSAKGRDAYARLDQLEGKAFLAAFETLKGGGQITEVEGVKAQKAMARMDRAQDETEFIAALKDFRDAVEAGVRKLQARVGQGRPGTTIQPPVAGSGQRLRFNPQTGELE